MTLPTTSAIAPHDPSVAWQRLLRGVEDACRRSGRAVDEITIVGASKRQPTDRLRAVYDAGLRVFGENRVQEAAAKQPELPVDIDWHLIGPLQSNKARRAVELFSTVHSVDRLKIARVLDREAARARRRLDVFVQLNLGAEASKSGLAPGEQRSCDEICRFENLRVRGLMAIPPQEREDPAKRLWFRQLRDVRDDLASRLDSERFGAQLSMGMSSDYELAIEEGATHIRVGSSLFGPRDS